ncbi:MAG: hypothetical protein WD941_05255 [Opitutus sp.]
MNRGNHRRNFRRPSAFAKATADKSPGDQVAASPDDVGPKGEHFTIFVKCSG